MTIASVIVSLILILIAAAVAYRFGINKEMKIQRNTKLKDLYDDLNQIIALLALVPPLPELESTVDVIMKNAHKLDELLNTVFGDAKLVYDEIFLSDDLRAVLREHHEFLYSKPEDLHNKGILLGESYHEDFFTDCLWLRERVKIELDRIRRWPL